MSFKKKDLTGLEVLIGSLPERELKRILARILTDGLINAYSRQTNCASNEVIPCLKIRFFWKRVDLLREVGTDESQGLGFKRVWLIAELSPARKEKKKQKSQEIVTANRKCWVSWRTEPPGRDDMSNMALLFSSVEKKNDVKFTYMSNVTETS
jgi:hypothetical protein